MPNIVLLAKFFPDMPGFHWEILHDVALAKEVATHCPQKPLHWLEIAEKLKFAFSTEEKHVLLKGRRCKDRLDLLLLEDMYTSQGDQELNKGACHLWQTWSSNQQVT